MDFQERSAVASPGNGGEAGRSRGFLEARGKVVEVVKSMIPGVTVYRVECGDLRVRFDANNKLLRLEPGDEVTITVSGDPPPYRKGVDYVAWGYVLSLKRGDASHKMVMSLWGYIVIVETERQELLSGFDFMDKVYFKVSRAEAPAGT